MRRRRAFLTVCALLSAAACDSSKAASAAADASRADRRVESAASPSTDDEVHSVYPADAGPPDPLAARLCTALHDVPEQRRATCCVTRPGVVFTSECVRTLTAALRFNAVTLDAAQIGRCETAMAREHEGCDWVGPFAPDVPKECDGIVRGVLETDSPCRSSLECRQGLHCRGSGPTLPGICRPARQAGDGCGGAVDALATYTRQLQADIAHPECNGYCDSHRCVSFVAKGGACSFAGQCAKETDCVAGKCSPHRVAKLGEPCPGGSCEAGARCIRGGCVAPARTGESCANDFECRGACIRGGKGLGVCGQRCDVR
jgi:hypothetical protein